MAIHVLLAYELPNSTPEKRVQFRWYLQELGWGAHRPSFTVQKTFAQDEAERDQMLDQMALDDLKTEDALDPDYWVGIAHDRAELAATIQRHVEEAAAHTGVFNWSFVFQEGAERPSGLSSTDLPSP